MRCWLVLLLGWAAVVEVRATFSSRFLFFLEDQFGRAAAETLARTDIGFQGSFGGGQHQAGKRTKSVRGQEVRHKVIPALIDQKRSSARTCGKSRTARTYQYSA